MDELLLLRNAIFEVIDQASKKKSQLVISGVISLRESSKIDEYENSLQEIANKLNHVILGVITTDIEEPGRKIIATTSKVNTAIEKLKDFNRFIGILAGAINIFSTIFTAFNTGNILKSSDLLAQIEKLT